MGTLQIQAGVTRDIRLGGLAFEVSKAFEDSRIDRVRIDEAGTAVPVVTVEANNNGDYNFVPKPLLPGRYDVRLQYAQSAALTLIVSGVIVKPDALSLVPLRSGIRLLPVKDSEVTGWDLLPIQRVPELYNEEDSGTQEPPPSGNQTTLWMPFLVAPGHYRLKVFVNGRAFDGGFGS